MPTYKDLTVWQKGMDLAVAVYHLTEKFPKEEVYGLTSQMRRCAVSIPSNIAEGKLRGSDKEFARFLCIAFGSAGELETQVLISKRMPRTAKLDYETVDGLLTEVMKILNRFTQNLKQGS